LKRIVRCSVGRTDPDVLEHDPSCWLCIGWYSVRAEDHVANQRGEQKRVNISNPAKTIIWRSKQRIRKQRSR